MGALQSGAVFRYEGGVYVKLWDDDMDDFRDFDTSDGCIYPRCDENDQVILISEDSAITITW